VTVDGWLQSGLLQFSVQQIDLFFSSSFLHHHDASVEKIDDVFSAADCVSGPVVRPTDETRARCFTNGYLRIQHDHRRCKGIEMISSRSLNKSSLFRYFILYAV